ncbi:hypothetical protein KW410_00110 [Vibrio fluvialis]|nr:hypothetical protein [Vibrio fluvialis]MBY7784571.1 hypothetical protein [Vibrio fluvialis]
MKLELDLLPDASLIRPEFRKPKSYDNQIQNKFGETTRISEIARALKVPYEEIIKWATMNNKAIPWQPKEGNQEGKYRGRIGEIVFSAMFDALDMNDIEPNHPGYDFEYLSSLVEIKSTSPKDGAKGSAKLTQGDIPDVYLVFRFNNMGVLRNAYLLPVCIIKHRPKGIPQKVTVFENQWISNFEVPFSDLDTFFQIYNYYRRYFQMPPTALPTNSKIESKQDVSEKLSNFLTFTQELSVNSLFSNKGHWWLNMFTAQVYYVRRFGCLPKWTWERVITYR